MTPTGPRRRLLFAGCIWTIVLAALIGFTAEPTTSTQFDAQEGRGIYVVQPLRLQVQVGDVAELVPGGAANVLLTLVTALLLAGGAALVVADAGTARGGITRWARAARRGPPALV